MKAIQFLLFPVVLVIASHSFAASDKESSSKPPRPNFIVINIDDLGYADIGPFGSKLNRTPNLDRMAKEGRRLTSFYAAPVCSPSRTALMTGCYPKRVLPIPGVLFPAGAVGVHPREQTVAEVLRAAGYATGCVGKWHLGDQQEFLPTAQGFDSYLGIPYSNDMGTAAEGSKSDLGAPLPKAALTAAPAAVKASQGGDETGLKGNSQPPLPLLENNRVIARVRQDEQQGIVERYTAAAVKFIAAKKDEPFFLYLAHNAVHFPLYPGKAWAGKSPHGLYSDWVEEVDWSVGQVLNALRQAKLDTSTLVIFTSDNGGTTRSVNSPLRGHKGSTWEGGMRVPTIAWWPGKIPGDTSTGAITGMLDVLPTFAALAGANLPEARIDGADISPVLLNERTPELRDTFYFYRGFALEAVRSGSWKLHLGGKAAPKGKGTKAKASPDAQPATPALYNLDDDIGESKNVAAEHPEIVKKLQALAGAMKDDLGLDGVGPGCRELGRVENPQPWISPDGAFRE